MRPVRQVISHKNLSLMGVPKKFHHVTINSFNTYSVKDLEEVKEFISNYLDNLTEAFENNSGLFLYGSNGVGKTLLSCIIVKEVYRKRYTARRVTFVEYINQYTRAWGAKSPSEKEQLEDILYNNYKAVEFLVLEEVGKEIDSKVSAPILEDLLRYREDKGLVTIMCTNITPSKMSEKYGASVASLMKGNMTPIRIEGADKRQEYFNNKIEGEEF